ncbi:PAS domain S-box protein [Methylobacterium sp. WL30]|nr:PAS domain S-box protein [Methylobacterium sp. WL93]TXN49347.1 PAS domain S-box protein [Methylobacterium sp. WL119]TXN61543.1 PAS domain S-box protein [Methylobacterium sp. WL30]
MQCAGESMDRTNQPQPTTETRTLPDSPTLELFEATPNPYLLLAPDGPIYTIVGVNEAYLHATMTKRAAIMGRSIFDVFPDDPTAPEAYSTRDLCASFDRVMRTGQPDRMPVLHYNIRRPDGVFEERHWRPLQVPVLGPGGEIVSLIHYAEDVTQGVLAARAARTALTASEARYRAIVESSTDYAMIATNLDGKITTWNAGAEHILGWSADEMVGQTVDRFFTPEDRADRIPAQEMHSALTVGRGIDERWHVRKNQERFWASGEMAPLKDEASAVIGFLKILRDRTPQRETELALERQSALLRTVTDHVSEAVFRLDPDGTIVFANPAVERLFDWTPDELCGRNFHDTLHHHHEDGAFFPAEACVFVNALREGTPLLGEATVFFRKDGEPVPVECTNMPFHAGGVVSGAVITVTDVTERRRTQEQQQTINHELSHRMKNVLAIVQAIAAQTMRSAPDLTSANETLGARLIALGRAHDILINTKSGGAEMRALAEAALGLHDDRQPGRFRIEGPPVAVGETAMMSLTLMLHELATNAAKYGALSDPAGSVRLLWRVAYEAGPPTFHLRWEERGGPLVTPPSRAGFGSRLIQRGLSGGSSGRVELSYQPDGVVCTLAAPLAEIEGG